MNKTILNKLFMLCALLMCVCLVGCGGSGSGSGGENKGEYDETRYTLYSTHTYTENFDFNKAKEAVTKANINLAKETSFSYNISVFGEYDEQHEYEGIAKFDLTGETPLASVELEGDLDYGFYIANNKAYINLDGYKTSYDFAPDFSDLIDTVQQAIGSFDQFDADMITAANLVSAGVDEYNVTVVRFDYEEYTQVTIVIFQEKIMKVLYSNGDLMEYTASYNYEPTTVTLPEDLDSYEPQQ